MRVPTGTFSNKLDTGVAAASDGIKEAHDSELLINVKRMLSKSDNHNEEPKPLKGKNTAFKQYDAHGGVEWDSDIDHAVKKSLQERGEDFQFKFSTAEVAHYDMAIKADREAYAAVLDKLHATPPQAQIIETHRHFSPVSNSFIIMLAYIPILYRQQT